MLSCSCQCGIRDGQLHEALTITAAAIWVVLHRLLSVFTLDVCNARPARDAKDGKRTALSRNLRVQHSCRAAHAKGSCRAKRRAQHHGKDCRVRISRALPRSLFPLQPYSQVPIQLSPLDNGWSCVLPAGWALATRILSSLPAARVNRASQAACQPRADRARSTTCMPRPYGASGSRRRPEPPQNGPATGAFLRPSHSHHLEASARGRPSTRKHQQRHLTLCHLELTHLFC